MPEATNKYKEIRIALVLYGGVALATYINGACRELFDLVKASNGEDSPYRKIVEDLESRVTIDIISGASAGGLNGVALAKTLVLGSNFERLEKFWVREAQIQNLLNSPRKSRLESLLSAEYYEAKLKEALDQLDRNDPAPQVDALDLFVATTDLHGNGRPYPAFDGDAIYTKSHQYPFVYRYRKGDDKDFRDENEALPKLWQACRATSAFPFAFPPLQYEKEGEKIKHYLSDGGILNNKPFEEAIEAIALRPANVYVDRVLFYVEPDPSFSKSDYKRLKEEREPLALDSVVVRTLLGIPRFESIGEDLKRLQMHNSSVKAHNEFAEKIEQWFHDEYLESAEKDQLIEPGAARLKECAFKKFRQGGHSQAYQVLKQHQTGQSMTQWLLGQNPEMDPATVAKRLREQEDDNPSNAREYYQAFDVDFRVRRFYYLTRQLIDDIKNISGAENFASFRLADQDEKKQELLKELMGQKEKLLAFASEALEVREAVHKELESRGIPLQDDNLARYLNEAAPLYRQWFQDIAGRSADVLQQIDSTLPQSCVNGRASYQLMSDAFELRDTFMLPSTFNRRLGERDYVELVPVTPAEATFIDVRQESKLAGESLMHFGGFFQEKWRRMDIMWGRLDTAEMIVRFLIQRLPGEARQGRDDDEMLKDYLMPIQQAIFEKYKADFPGSPRPGQDYRSFLQEAAEDASHVGDQTIKDLPPKQVVPVVLNTLGVVHRMVETLRDKRQDRPVLAIPYKGLARGLGYINNFASLASTLLFPSSSFIKFAIALLIIGALGWSVGVLAVNFSGFQSLAPATLFLGVLVGLIALTVLAFNFRLTWGRFIFLAIVLAALVGLAAIDVRYSEAINQIVAGFGASSLVR